MAKPLVAGKDTAKRKYEDEHRAFLSEWEDSCFFVERNRKPFCLICQTLCRLWDHFTPFYRSKDSERCKHKVNTLKCQSEKQTLLFRKFTKHSETVTLSHYRIRLCKSPFSRRWKQNLSLKWSNFLRMTELKAFWRKEPWSFGRLCRLSDIPMSSRLHSNYCWCLGQLASVNHFCRHWNKWYQSIALLKRYQEYPQLNTNQT